MGPIHTIIRNLIDSPNQKRMILDRLSELYIPESVGRVVTLHNPEFPDERYELSLYGHTEDFERLSLYKGKRKNEVLASKRLKERKRERPIMVCTQDGRIFFDLNLRHDGMPYKEYREHIRSILQELGKFKEAFDTLAA